LLCGNSSVPPCNISRNIPHFHQQGIAYLSSCRLFICRTFLFYRHRFKVFRRIQMHPTDLPTTYPLRLSRTASRFWDPVVLLAFSHMSALVFVAGCEEGVHTERELFPFPYVNYVGTIVASTLASTWWHAMHEQKGGVFYLNLLLSGIWVAYDLYLGFTRAALPGALAIVLLNVFTGLLYTSSLSPAGWQLCSLSKCLLVAYTIGCNWKLL
jgi:hypothetical protein